MPYTDGVGWKEPTTSWLAAEKAAETAHDLQQLVIRTMRAGIFPMTGDEIARACKRDVLSIRPRLTELRRRNIIRDSKARRRGDRGRLQICWELT